MLTILTPVYNRAHLIKKVYESLQAQTIKDFEWIIVDDGSTDNLKDTIDELSAQEFFVKFIAKPNGGKHTAINEGLKHAKGELTLILDSDDFLTPDAVEIVLKEWESAQNKEQLCGLSFLKCKTDGDIVGKKFPENRYRKSYIDCRINEDIWGDKAEVFRTELLQSHPFPVFSGERFLGESIVWAALGKIYDTLHINQVIYVCEYLEGGLSQSGRAMRIRNPLGGMEYAKTHIDKRIKLKIRLKMILLYLTYARFANIKLKEAKSAVKTDKLFLLLMTLPSYFLYKKWSKLL